jgi:hypothetical protein
VSRNSIEEVMAYPREVANRHHMYAFIAGGYIRDTLLHKPVKDIDVFMIPAEHLHFEASTAEQLAADEDMVVTSESSELSEASLNDHICLTTGIVKGNIRYPYNFVFLDTYVTPDAILNTFDFGICQIGIDENMEVLAFPEFWKDVLNKTVTLLRYRSEERKEYRVGKMMDKFFDYKLVENR